MKTLRIILVVVAILVTVFSVALANIQGRYAADAWGEVERLKEEIVTMQKEADRQRHAAMETAAVARVAAAEYEVLVEALEKCQK